MIGASCAANAPTGLLRPTALILLVVAASLTTLCGATSLPPTVVSGYTVCANTPDCNGASPGTTLQVATMTGDAKTADNATALFKTSRKLVVDCLTYDPSC